jgi:hypothetical protein
MVRVSPPVDVDRLADDLCANLDRLGALRDQLRSVLARADRQTDEHA